MKAVRKFAKEERAFQAEETTKSLKVRAWNILETSSSMSMNKDEGSIREEEEWEEIEEERTIMEAQRTVVFNEWNGESH